MSDTKKFECVRCGQCCISVGRTFWKNGDFSGIPELEIDARSEPYIDEGLPCEMLQMVDGLASCKIQEKYGYDMKPQVCREYPTQELDDRECRRQKEIMNERICYHNAG